MSAKEYRSGKQTKEWILETAVKLFNEYGTQAVSTKRIAAEMGISPGNLYYHYKNKEEIIRAVFKQMSQDFALGQGTGTPLQKMLNMNKAIISLWNSCPFFQRELVVLLSRDEKLKSLYMRDKRLFKEKTLLLFKELKDSGVLKNGDDPDSLDALYTVEWMIVDFWISFLDINETRPSEESLLKGIDLIIQIWRPYLCEEAYMEFLQWRKEL